MCMQFTSSSSHAQRYHSRMEAYLTAQTSCAILRLGRQDEWLHLGKSGRNRIDFDEMPRSKWWLPVIDELSPYIILDDAHPLCALVPDRRYRSKDNQIRTTVCSKPMPMGSFLSVELDDSNRMYAIESPALSFVRMAQHLERAMRKSGPNKLSLIQARTLLLDYGCELCGKYARNPIDPWHANCNFEVTPITTPREILDWCSAPEVAGMRSITFARRCATELPAMAASPAEALLDIFFTSPPELGGMGLPKSQVLVNQTLRLDDHQKSLVHRTPLTPDIRFEDLGLVLEHQGSGHADSDQFREDASRIQDYGALGYDVFTTSSDDTKTPAAFDAFLMRFVSWIEHEHGPDAAAPYQTILGNQHYKDARSDLVSTLIERNLDPWAPDSIKN